MMDLPGETMGKMGKNWGSYLNLSQFNQKNDDQPWEFQFYA